MAQTLTLRQRMVLKSYWKMPIRVRAGRVEAKKRGYWGTLYDTVEQAVKEADLIIKNSKK